MCNFLHPATSAVGALPSPPKPNDFLLFWWGSPMDLASVWNYQNFITLTSNTFDVFWILTELVKVAMSTTATSMLLVLRLMSLKCAEVWSSFHDLYTRQVVQYQGKLCPRDIVQDRGFMTLIKRKQSWCANISFHHRKRKKIHWKHAEKKKDWRSQIKYTLSVHL